MNATTDNHTMAPWLGTEPGAVILDELEVRSALPEEMERVRTALKEEHYLGAGRPVGRTLVQIVHHRERWAAILIWGPAAMRLIDRDEWIGWTQRHRADFYREHKRPKKLWLKPLSRNTRVILTGMDLPAAYQPGCDLQTAERALPLKKAHIESLRDVLREVPDPRAGNRSWPISTLLSLICMGLLAGRKSLAAIHRYGQFLTPQQRAWLNFLPNLRGRPGRRAPSYQALYHLLRLLDPNTLADTLNGWLAAHHGTLPRALALDGKYVRDLLLTLALSEHESGAPVAVTIASKEPKSEAAKPEGEITAAKRLYQSVDLRNAVVTGDALHCERENMQLVIENDGDFFFQLKGNQPTALTEAQRIAAVGSPLLTATPKSAGTVG